MYWECCRAVEISFELNDKGGAGGIAANCCAIKFVSTAYCFNAATIAGLDDLKIRPASPVGSIRARFRSST